MLNGRRFRWILAALATCVLAVPASAQTHDVPSFWTPYGETGFGLYLVFVNEVDDLGFIGNWRRAGENVDLGLRAGFYDVAGELGLMAGLELGNQFVTANEEFPLDVAWASGVGVGLVPEFDFGIVRIPIGVSLGRRLALDDGSTFITPYVHPRLAVDIVFFDPPGPGTDSETDTDLNVDVDLGVDVELTPEILLRLGITLGENEAIGLGVAF